EIAMRLAEASAKILLFIDFYPPNRCFNAPARDARARFFDERLAPCEQSPRRKAEPGQQPAEVLALLERDPAAVDLGNVANDCEAEAGAGLAGGIEARAAVENRAALAGRDPGAVVL